MRGLRGFARRIRQYARRPDVESIARRYFILGAFDGALTILGVILGAAASGNLDDRLVMSAGIGGGIALAISSTVGAYEAERIEAKVNGKESGKRSMTIWEGGYPKGYRIKALIPALVHGIAPLIAAIVPVIPFLLFDTKTAAIVSVTITLSFLFLMGLYLGSVVKERMIFTGIRFVLIGIVTSVIIVVLFGG
jgi:predicted membrane protein (TIGR00267 family)